MQITHASCNELAILCTEINDKNFLGNGLSVPRKDLVSVKMLVSVNGTRCTAVCAVDKGYSLQRERMGVKGPIEMRPASTKEKRFDFALGSVIKLISMGGGAAGVVGLTMNLMPLEMAYYVLAVSFVLLCFLPLQDAITQRRDYIELKRNIRRVKINMNVY